MPTATGYIEMARQAEQSGDHATAQRIYEGLQKQGYDVASAPGMPQVIDDGEGLPWKERAKLSGLTPEQQRSYLERTHGSVHTTPEGHLAVPNEDGHFIKINPEGFELGDVADYGREIFQTVGGTVGGLAGSVAATPTVAGIPAGAVAGGAVGSTGGGELYDYLVRVMTGEEDERSLTETAQDVGTSAAIDLVAPVALSKAGSVLKTAVHKALASKAGREVAEAGVRQSVDPSAGMVGRSPVSWTESAIATAPMGSGTTLERVRSEIGKALSTKLDTITQMETPAAIGSYVKGRVLDYADTFKAAAKSKYNAVSEAVPGSERFDFPSTSRLVRDRVERYADDPKFAEVLRTPFGRRLEGLLESDDVSYRALNTLRSEIGEAVASGDTAILAGASTGDLKQLYKAITMDLERGIAGYSEEALSLWKDANDFYRRGAQLMEEHVQPLIGKGVRPEDIAVKLINQSKRGGTTLKALADGGVLDTEDIEVLGAAFMRRAAIPRAGNQSANPEHFNPHTFSTEINKLSPEARATVFQGDLANDLDDLLLLSNAYKDATEGINRSGTAGAVNMMQLGGGGAGAVQALAQGDMQPLLAAGTAAFGIPAAMNLILQNPATKSMLTNGAPVPALFQEVVGLLVAQGMKQPEAEEAAAGAIKQLQAAPQGQAPMPPPMPAPGQVQPPQEPQPPNPVMQQTGNPYMVPGQQPMQPQPVYDPGPRMPTRDIPQMYSLGLSPDLSWFIS